MRTMDGRMGAPEQSSACGSGFILRMGLEKSRMEPST